MPEIPPGPPVDAALRAQALQYERARDGERRRIARELHDELGQLLNGARMEIARLHRQPGALSAEGLDRLDELLAHAAAFARRLARSLRPPALDHGIVPALEALCQDFRVRSGLRCTLAAPEDVVLPDFVAQTVYRVADAALANVVQHARASTATLRLRLDDQGLTLLVADDGVGLDRTRPAPVLHGLPARVALLGGGIGWDTGAGGGTQLHLRLPPEALQTQGEPAT